MSCRGPSQTSISATEPTAPRPRPKATRRATAPGGTAGTLAERFAMRSSVVLNIGASVSAAERLQAAVDGDLHGGLRHAVLLGRLADRKTLEPGRADQVAGARRQVRHDAFQVARGHGGVRASTGAWRDEQGVSLLGRGAQVEAAAAQRIDQLVARDGVG